MFLTRLIQHFETQSLDYALVGGFAVALHGAVRGTVDIDLVITLSKDQLEKAEIALNSMGLESTIPVSAQEIFSFREEYISQKNLIAWNFVNPINPVESVDILLTHDLSQISTTTKKIGTFDIQIVSIDSLIEMKKRAGRKQDLEDVKALEKLK